MVATKRYIQNKFDNPFILIDELDEWLTIDIRNRNNLFDCPCVSFNLDSKMVYADIPVNIEDVDNAIMKLEKYGFKILEIHNHKSLQHIHIKGQFDKNIIDLIADIFK